MRVRVLTQALEVEVGMKSAEGIVLAQEILSLIFLVCGCLGFAIWLISLLYHLFIVGFIQYDPADNRWMLFWLGLPVVSLGVLLLGGWLNGARARRK